MYILTANALRDLAYFAGLCAATFAFTYPSARRMCEAAGRRRRVERRAALMNLPRV